MPNESGEGVFITNETAKAVDRAVVAKRIDSLSNKYRIDGCLGDLQKVAEIFCNFVDKYQLPESFLDDDINSGLLIGCSQKLSEIQDPLYRQRVENFIECLVQPVTPAGTTKIENKGGFERREIDNMDKLLEYVKNNSNPELSNAMQQKLQPSIERCQVLWGASGYDLQLNVFVVDQNDYQFKRQTGSSGFIATPEDEEIATADGPIVINLVVPRSAVDKEDVWIHELYHVEDRFGMVRRGYQQTVFESVDELHTEYAVGNYGGDKDREDGNLASYLELKNFWHKITRLSTLDNTLLQDRQRLLTKIIEEFGFEGLADFAMLDAHYGGSATWSQTMYKDCNRPIMAMLISREKIKQRKTKEGIDYVKITKDLETIGKWLKPSEDGYPRHRNIFDLLPNPSPKNSGDTVYANFGKWKGTAEFNEIKEIVSSYPKALACLELEATGKTNAEINNQKLDHLTSLVSFKREKVDYNPQEEANKWTKGENQDEDGQIRLENIKSMYANLVRDFNGIDFVFSLTNTELRTKILNQFFIELDKVVSFCVESNRQEFIDAFAQGLYRSASSWELREYSATYITETYPQTKQAIDRERSQFIERNPISISA